MQRQVVLGFSVVIVVAAIAVGLFGAAGSQPSESDSANVSVVSLPGDSITIERGRLGSGRYYVDAPPAVVDIDDVSGTPILRYVIDIPGAWLTVTTRYGLGDRKGRLQMRPSPDTVSPEYVDREQYNATVAIWIRTGTNERDVIQRDVSVEVEE